MQGVKEGVEEKVLFGYFSKCGEVHDIKILRNRYDNVTGIAIVEFESEESVNHASNLLDGQMLNGHVLNIKRADTQLVKSNPAPKRMMTRQQFTQQVLSGLKTGTGAETGPNMRKLHIKNLRPVVTEDDMRGIFKPFGTFEAFEMGGQECWITFQNQSDAQDAMSSMQGFQLVGQELQISVLSAVVAAPEEKPAEPKKPELIDFKTDTDWGASGASLNNVTNRMEIMKKLLSSHSQQGVPTVVGLTAPTPGQTAPPAASPNPLATMPPAPKAGTSISRTLLLQNMFTPSSINLQKDPRFYEEIREDTHDECAKFGKVLHVTVDPRGSTGLIYVLFEGAPQRSQAELALNGRWFEGKKIIATGIDDSIWQMLAAQAQEKA